MEDHTRVECKSETSNPCTTSILLTPATDDFVYSDGDDDDDDNDDALLLTATIVNVEASND
jgi:hypothetical protein